MKPQRKLPAQFSLILRAAAGVYLLYTGWDLREAISESWFFLLAVIFFGAAGVILLFHSVRALYKGEFENGKADPKWDQPREEEKDGEE